MTHGMPILVALLLLTGTSASAAEAAAKKKGSDAEKAQAAETPREKLEKKRAGQRGAMTVDPKKAAAAAELASAIRAKSVYMFAVEACEQPTRCDAALRDDAEERFMEACRACAPDERCDAERAAIKGGTAKRSEPPCGP